MQYILLADVNDSTADAASLAAFLRTVGPPARLHVNLIPYNEQSAPLYAPPSEGVCKAFKAALMAEGFFTKIRATRGARKMAACGQLGNVQLRYERGQRRRQAARDGGGGGGSAGEELPTGDASSASASLAAGLGPGRVDLTW